MNEWKDVFMSENCVRMYQGVMQSDKGLSIYDIPKNQVFDSPVHMGRTPAPLWISTRGQHEIYTALLKWLVQWPTGPKSEIQLYDSNLFKLYY